MLAMGPRASSKGKRCHELVGGPKSDARKRVQLVRARTLSSHLHDGRSWAKVSNGVTLGSLGKSRALWLRFCFVPTCTCYRLASVGW